ncbi:MAG: G5 domain-containing protein [Synergistes sp.]|nr:G5 domain-containing protein [Synergistes sp.]
MPFLEVQITRTEVYEEETPFQIIQTVDASQYEGYYNRTQVGRNGVSRVTAQVTYLNGIETSREIVSTVNCISWKIIAVIRRDIE